MADLDLRDPETFRKLLSYEPDTGFLIWKYRTPEMFEAGDTAVQSREAKCARWNTRYGGQRAFATICSQGYHTGNIALTTFRGCRVAWAVHHGKWPVGVIDHINRVKTDDRLSNLRDVTTSENGRNRALDRRNKTGASGVQWIASREKWSVQASFAGRNFFIGYYDSHHDAVTASAAASIAISKIIPLFPADAGTLLIAQPNRQHR